MNRRATAMTLPAPKPLGGRRELATKWWGERWVDSLEDPDGQAYGYSSSGRDGRLARGRTYARQGSVGEITVRAGYLAARVKGSRRTPYRCEIHVPELPDATWETLLGAWAATGPELLRELAEGDLGDLAIEAALAVEVLLTPLPDEFTYFCSCPDWGDPCKHAAALSYAFAHTLDTRHDALLTLRGGPLSRHAWTSRPASPGRSRPWPTRRPRSKPGPRAYRPPGSSHRPGKRPAPLACPTFRRPHPYSRTCRP